MPDTRYDDTETDVTVPWPTVISAVRLRSPRAAAVVESATHLRNEGHAAVLMFPDRVHADMLRNAPDVLTRALTYIVGGDWTVRCDVDPDAVHTPQEDPF